MNNFINRYNKGDFYYANFQKKKSIIIAAIMYALSLSLYFAGYITTKSNKNLLTIVAVLGLLPASKCLISAIMNLRVKESTEDFKAKIDDKIGGLTGLYNMYFTSYDTNFYLKHLIITSNSVICFTDDPKFDTKKFQEHLKKHMQIDGITDIVIKVFSDENGYLRRFDELNSSETDLTPNAKLYSLLLSISL